MDFKNIVKLIEFKYFIKDYIFVIFFSKYMFILSIVGKSSGFLYNILIVEKLEKLLN